MAKARVCPLCGAAASEIVYGFMPGPPDDDVVMGGCVITPGRDPEFACPSCYAEWRKGAGITVITSSGDHVPQSLPPRCIRDDVLARAAEDIRPLLAQGTSQEQVEALLARAGKPLGLTAKQSLILIPYL